MVIQMRFVDENNFITESKFVEEAKLDKKDDMLEARFAMYENKKKKRLAKEDNDKANDKRRKDAVSDDRKDRRRDDKREKRQDNKGNSKSNTKNNNGSNKQGKKSSTESIQPKITSSSETPQVKPQDVKVDAPKKAADPNLKKKAAKQAISTLDIKGKVKEDLHDTSLSYDAMQDGNKGAVGFVTTLMNPFTYLKMMIKALIAVISPVLIAASGIILLFAFIAVFIIAIVMNTSAGYNGLEGYLANYQVDGRMHKSLSPDEIRDIKGSLFMTESQDKCVSFALDKVGLAYSQPHRTSGWAYDCSSLAYYAYLYAGVDLSNGGGYPPTADAEAKYLLDRGMAFSTNSENFNLCPGDLIFYAREGEPYFMNIYHVAIYIGNGYCVEALGTKWGVVYQPLRTKNAVLAGHILN